ncbi:MAG TPA: LysM peptidoglycan-binding domain-containing protein [Gemmatimonadota bacterium]|nr:LysM peptidoglycan-binding domain-containing protein [Gemmatimonadota bacterium]
MSRLAPAIVAAMILAACAANKPPVSSYGPPPRVTEPTPTASEEFALIVGDELTAQEQQDLATIRTTIYTPPSNASPPQLDAGLEELLAQEGAVLIHEKVGYDIPIVLNDRVEWWIDYFTYRLHDSFERYLIRSGAWMPYLKAQLREAGLPEDMAYLALIESGFSTQAVSHAGAVGPWQFMPYTGREYGLRIDRWVDERRDYEKATQAAIAYLSDLHAMLGSWYLAAAGYNGGQGRVGRAMMRDNTINFWELTGIHDETKNYVPKLIAATLIAKEPERYGFYAVPYLEAVEWETVTVPTSSDVAVIAAAAEVPVETIRALNPHLLRGRTPPGEINFPVHIPAGQVDEFTENYYAMPPVARVDESPADDLPGGGRPDEPVEHIVRDGETVVGIATAYGVDPRELMEANDLSSEADLEDGMVLRVPGGVDSSELMGFPEQPAEPSTAAPSPTSGGPPPTLARAQEVEAPRAARTHRVKRGETLMALSRMYGIPVDDIRRENGIQGDRILVGQVLRIPE